MNVPEPSAQPGRSALEWRTRTTSAVLAGGEVQRVLARALDLVNEDLAVVGLRLDARPGGRAGHWKLRCRGEAASVSSAGALVILGDELTVRFHQCTPARPLPRAPGGDVAAVTDLLLAVVETMASAPARPIL